MKRKAGASTRVHEVWNYHTQKRNCCLAAIYWIFSPCRVGSIKIWIQDKGILTGSVCRHCSFYELKRCFFIHHLYLCASAPGLPQWQPRWLYRHLYRPRYFRWRYRCPHQLPLQWRSRWRSCFLVPCLSSRHLILDLY